MCLCRFVPSEGENHEQNNPPNYGHDFDMRHHAGKLYQRRSLVGTIIWVDYNWKCLLRINYRERVQPRDVIGSIQDIFEGGLHVERG